MICHYLYNLKNVKSVSVEEGSVTFSKVASFSLQVPNRARHLSLSLNVECIYLLVCL